MYRIQPCSYALVFCLISGGATSREWRKRENQSGVGGGVGWWLEEAVVLSWCGMIVSEGIERSARACVCVPSRHGKGG